MVFQSAWVELKSKIMKENAVDKYSVSQKEKIQKTVKGGTLRSFGLIACFAVWCPISDDVMISEFLLSNVQIVTCM